MNVKIISYMRCIYFTFQEFGFEFYFLQVWNDSHFKLINSQKDATMSFIGAEIDQLWIPDTVFVNSKSSFVHRITVDNKFLLADFNTGQMAYHTR